MQWLTSGLAEYLNRLFVKLGVGEFRVARELYCGKRALGRFGSSGGNFNLVLETLPRRSILQLTLTKFESSKAGDANIELFSVFKGDYMDMEISPKVSSQPLRSRNKTFSISSSETLKLSKARRVVLNMDIIVPRYYDRICSTSES